MSVVNRAIVVTLLLFLLGYVPGSSGALPALNVESTSGQYLEFSTADVYYYDASTGALVKTIYEGTSTSNDDQAGFCTYTDDWKDPDSTFAYGRCISMAHDGNATLVRVDVKEAYGPPSLRVYLKYLVFDENQILQSDPTSYARRCSVDIIATCKAYDVVEPPVVPASWQACPKLQLFERDAQGQETLSLEVYPKCP